MTMGFKAIVTLFYFGMSAARSVRKDLQRKGSTVPSARAKTG